MIVGYGLLSRLRTLKIIIIKNTVDNRIPRPPHFPPKGCTAGCLQSFTVWREKNIRAGARWIFYSVVLYK